MKKLFPILVTLFVLSSVAAQAQRTKQVLRKTIISHFYTLPLDEMLDSISVKYKLPIFFEREQIHKMDVNNRFFEESLQDVLKFVCRENGLQYWIENDGTIYILQNPDDLPHLKKLKQFSKEIAAIKPIVLEAPKGPPVHHNFSISGRVTDQNTGEALPGATVKVRNTNINTLSNVSGNFTLLNIPSDTVALEVSFVGYQPDAFRLNSKSIDSALTLSLFPTLNSLSEVNINGKKTGVLNTDSKRVSVLQLAPAALDKLPNIGERDVMRAFQLMPGVSATNESSSGAYVRGGTPDQNLVTFDGFTVYQVDHLYGFFSAFNSNAVRDVELYKGGFSGKYGGRLSSVTVITGKDGNKNEANVGGDLSLLSTNIYAETPVGSNSSLLIAARRSYQGPLYDKLFGQFNTATTNNAPPGGGPGGGRGFGGGRGGFNTQTTPASNFYDLNAKYVFTPSKKNSFALSLYNGADNLNNSREMVLPAFSVTNGGSDITINDYSRSGNTGASLRWTSTVSRKLYANTVLSYSEYFSDRNRGTQGTRIDSGITTSFNNGMVEHNLLRDFSLKSDWELHATSKAKLIYGGFGSMLHIQYNYTQNDTSKLITQDNRGTIGGGYVGFELDPTTKLHIEPSLRETYFSPTSKIYTEPRLTATYQVNKEFNLKGSIGRFYQYTNQVVREDVTGGDRNFWVLANNSAIPVGRADHYIFGFNYETENFLFNVEGYYKDLTGLTEYSIRQTGGGGRGPFGGFSATTPTVTENFYNGIGYAKGIEFLLQKKAGSYTGWLSYTLGQAKSKFDVYGPDYFSSNQDITHELKSINMYHLQRWSFSAVFIISTGHPYTAPLGSYTVATLDGNKTTYLSISDKNGERLPAYHRLDMSATYDILKFDGAKTGSIGLSLFNVYNHVNTWYNEYLIQGSQVATTTVKYLGFTPNITLSLKWK